MAIAHDADSVIAVAATTSPATWNHTCTGANLLLVVALEANKTSDPVTAVKYNSVSMSKITGASIVDATNGITISYWYLLGPSTGSNQISVTWTSGGGINLMGGAISLTGVKQSSQPDASGTNSGTTGIGGTNQPTVTITTIAANSWMIGAVGVNDNSALSAGALQTKAYEFDESASPFHTIAGSYRGPQIIPGTDTINFTGTVNTDNWVIGAASFSPSVAPATGSPQSTLLGIGA